MADETVQKVTIEEKSEERKKVRRAEAIVIDLGKKSRKDVRDLRRGRGRLMEDVQDCLEELRDAGEISSPNQPVIVVVERKLSSREGLMPFLLPPGISALLPVGREEDDEDDDDDDED